MLLLLWSIHAVPAAEELLLTLLLPPPRSGHSLDLSSPFSDSPVLFKGNVLPSTEACQLFMLPSALLLLLFHPLPLPGAPKDQPPSSDV